MSWPCFSPASLALFLPTLFGKSGIFTLFPSFLSVCVTRAYLCLAEVKWVKTGVPGIKHLSNKFRPKCSLSIQSKTCTRKWAICFMKYYPPPCKTLSSFVSPSTKLRAEGLLFDHKWTPTGLRSLSLSPSHNKWKGTYFHWFQAINVTDGSDFVWGLSYVALSSKRLNEMQYLEIRCFITKTSDVLKCWIIIELLQY